MLNKNRMVLATADEEYVLNDGWKDFGPKLRDALETQGRRVVEESDEDWRVEPA